MILLIILLLLNYILKKKTKYSFYIKICAPQALLNLMNFPLSPFEIVRRYRYLFSHLIE
jgi:predicted membrane-bound dolichyl-phosphate-mannose-protein mannosyltransferase